MAVLKKMGRKKANFKHPKGKIICYKCLIAYPRTAEFFHRNKNSRRGDGLINACKKCQREIVNLKRAEDPEYHAKGQTYVEKYKKKYPEKDKARREMHKAVQRGDLIKEACRDCGDTKVEGHHPDYSQPLLVVWLCEIHHEAEHEKLRLARGDANEQTI